MADHDLPWNMPNPMPMNSPTNSQYDARLASFSIWPKFQSHYQQPEDLCDAGFYYTKIGDHVKCFMCGLTLKNWFEHQLPWEQHAIYAPHCNYLAMARGTKFINEARGKTVVRVE